MSVYKVSIELTVADVHVDFRNWLGEERHIKTENAFEAVDIFGKFIKQCVVYRAEHGTQAQTMAYITDMDTLEVLASFDGAMLE